MSVSQYTDSYTKAFAHKIGKVLQLSAQTKEAQGTSTQFAESFASDDNPQESKRRRIEFKSPPDPGTASDVLSRVEAILQEADHVTPRVGRNWMTSGKILDQLQNMFPEMSIVAIDVCRGINRMRVPPNNVNSQTCPFRRAMGRKREDQSVILEPKWERWNTLSHRQQIRAGVPTKLQLTMIARPREEPTDQPMCGKTDLPPNEGQVQQPDVTTTPYEPTQPVPEPLREQIIGPTEFRALPDKLQNQIRKIHKNLGHPGLAQMKAALQSEGWSQTVIQALSDFACDICREQEAPKIARPAHMSSPKDFNDLVSFDALEWKSPNGESYWCYHFIDSATNFHTAIAIHQGTSHSLIKSFEEAWIRWAGPPKEVMFDSCGEANSQTFSEFLQEHNVKAYPIPSRAHWQLGRAERNGAILKMMLTKYHVEHAIKDHEAFSQALLHLCNAKNSLSKHAGYSPELLVLGKSRRTPGSIMDNDPTDASSFADTEGSRFRHQMLQREAARIAYVKTDQCSILRKSLHARSRPHRMIYTIGDWVNVLEVKQERRGKMVGPGQSSNGRAQCHMAVASHATLPSGTGTRARVVDQ